MIDKFVDKCMGPHLLRILEAHGSLVEGLGSRNGRRAEMAKANVGTSPNWGGKRVEGESPPQKWCHPDALSARAARVTSSAATHASSSVAGGGSSTV
eukprot:SAG11_NODE_2269_length_3596_cov_2.380612_4_plen_97_part_00